MAAIITPLCIVASLVWSLFDRSGNGPHLVARFWAKAIMRASLVRVEVSGGEDLDPHEPYVFAANHSSIFDILVLLAYLPFQFRWLAKEELFRIPFFGASMKSIGYIPIDRSNPRAGVRSLKHAADRIRAGASVIIFPEGTRTRDGRIQDFKRGGFTLAVRAGRPVVPVSISGAFRILPPKSLKLRPGHIKIVLDRAVPTAGLDRDEQNRLIEKVRQAIISNFDPDYKGPRLGDGS